MNPTARSLLDCGLLQFGLFGDAPLAWNVDMLPSFPGLLRALACLSEAYVKGVDRMLAAPGALVWGSAVALQCDVPLVHCRGEELVGAFDIGHPTLLLDVGMDGGPDLRQLARRAGQVGLEVVAVHMLLGPGSDEPGDLPTTALFDLSELVGQLVAEGALPPGHGERVQRWLVNRHQGAAGP